MIPSNPVALVDKAKKVIPTTGQMPRLLIAAGPDRLGETMRLLEGDLLKPSHHLITDLLTKEKGGQIL